MRDGNTAGGGGQNEEKPAQREGKRQVISKSKINNSSLKEEFKEDPRIKEFKQEEEEKGQVRGKSPSYRAMSEDHRKYLGVLDEDLNGCID